MRCLAIETSTRDLSAALVDNQEVLLEVRGREEHPRAHRIWSSFMRAFQEAGYLFEEVDCVAVGTGPGRFTGIRAAVALGTGLRIALDRPLRGAPSLDLLAYAARERAVRGESLLSYLPRPGSDSFYVRSYVWEEDGPVARNDIEWVEEEELERLGLRSTWLVGPDASDRKGSGGVTAWPRASELARWVASAVSRPWPVFPLEYATAPRVRPRAEGDS